MTSPKAEAKGRRLVVAEKLLLAALEIRDGMGAFTSEDLVIQAWKMFPESFGLPGYSSEYPDSHSVFRDIMLSQPSGTRKKGWFRKVGKKQFRVTSAGLSHGEGLLLRMKGKEAADKALHLSREIERRRLSSLELLASTPTAKKILYEGGRDLSFLDACGFWDITARSKPATAEERLRSLDSLLGHILETLQGQSGAVGVRLPSGRVLSRDEVVRLAAADQSMRKEFKRELDIILGRDPVPAKG